MTIVEVGNGIYVVEEEVVALWRSEEGTAIQLRDSDTVRTSWDVERVIKAFQVDAPMDDDE